MSYRQSIYIKENTPLDIFRKAAKEKGISLSALLNKELGEYAISLKKGNENGNPERKLSINNETFGAYITSLRESSGLTMKALSDKSGVSVNNIRLIMRGKISPTCLTAHVLLTALGGRWILGDIHTKQTDIEKKDVR